MDYLWTPWRYRYITTAGKDDSCVLCDAPAAGDDRGTLIVLRAKTNYIILNRFPLHLGPRDGRPLRAPCDAGGLRFGNSRRNDGARAPRPVRARYSVLHPDGYNLGMNLGQAAGAGIAGHIHMHVLPRWFGDTNFMTAVGETRVEPEDLAVTYEKLRGALQS